MMKLWIDDDYANEIALQILKTTFTELVNIRAKNDYMYEEDRLEDERVIAALDVVIEYYGGLN